MRHEDLFRGLACRLLTLQSAAGKRRTSWKSLKWRALLPGTSIGIDRDLGSAWFLKERKVDMAKRTRQAIQKLPVEAVDARKGKEIRGGGTRIKKPSKGETKEYFVLTMENTLISG